MPNVRSFSRADLPQVVELFARTFRSGRAMDQAKATAYFERVYFENPWQDDDIPSLVYDDGRGKVIGFLGAVPRPMRFRGNRLRTAVIGNLMVETEAAGALASAQLLKECIAGAQDLTLTDSAGDHSRRIFELCGGEAVLSASLNWLRPIRPCSLGAERLLARRSPVLRALAKPVCRVMDFGVGLTRLGPFRPGEHGCEVEALDADGLASRFASLTGYALLPDYDAESLGWLLDMAAANRLHGNLRMGQVKARESDGVLGWFLYYLKPGGTCEVLQLGALHSVDRVFGCLVEDAASAGATAVTGRLDPRFMNDLAQQHCLFLARSWVLVHARKPELAGLFHRGDAFFSGLEGEQWTRFIADPFQD